MRIDADGSGPRPRTYCTQAARRGCQWRVGLGQRAPRLFKHQSAFQENRVPEKRPRRAPKAAAQWLYVYRTKGLVDQTARVLYRWADPPEIDQDLLEIAHRARRAAMTGRMWTQVPARRCLARE